MDRALTSTCCNAPDNCISATNCSNRNDNTSRGLSINDRLNSTETEINECSDAPRSMSPLWKSSISQGQKFEHLFQESRPIPTTRQEYRAPVGPMFANLCCQLPSPQVPTEAQKSLFLDQDEPKPNINKSRRDSGVDMLQDGEGGDVGPEEECRHPIAKDKKRKQSASQSPGMETSKRTKGVAYPVKDGESISKRQRQRRKFCMSSAEAEEFRARQVEYLHDDNAKIISEIPRFTRSQKKVLKNEVMNQPARSKPSTGLHGTHETSLRRA